MKELVDELQQEDSMEYNELKMLPPDKEYSRDEIKRKMKQFNDPEDDKILLDRKEFMRFWSKEFDQQIKDAPLSKEMVQLQHLIDVLKNSSTTSA